jgi:Tfp pilus assembly protein PilN
MVRINLLPREITEKRKFESRIGWVLLLGLAAVVVIAVIFVGLLLVVGAQNAQLQQQLEANAQVSQQAEAYAIFEEKEATLASRESVAMEALDGRIEWGRIATEVSLVLPTDMWLESMTGDEVEGLVLLGHALDSATDSPDVGYTSVAAMMVRLSELELVSSVWLNSAEKTYFGEAGEEEGAWGGPTILYEVSTSVLDTAEEETQSDPSVPAPPSQPAE